MRASYGYHIEATIDRLKLACAATGRPATTSATGQPRSLTDFNRPRMATPFTWVTAQGTGAPNLRQIRTFPDDYPSAATELVRVPGSGGGSSSARILPRTGVRLDIGQGDVRFGTFELDLRTGELRKGGFRVRLQEQPLRILA